MKDELRKYFLLIELFTFGLIYERDENYNFSYQLIMNFVFLTLVIQVE